MSSCPNCNKVFVCLDVFEDHVARCKDLSSVWYTCSCCDKSFKSYHYYSYHCRLKHQLDEPTTRGGGRSKSSTVLREIKIPLFVSTRGVDIGNDLRNVIAPRLIAHYAKVLTPDRNGAQRFVKTNVLLQCDFVKLVLGEQVSIDQPPWFSSETRVLYRSIVEKECRDIEQELLVKIEEFTQLGSGWILSELMTMTVKYGFYSPLAGKGRASKQFHERLVWCPKNVDDQCFRYVIERALYPLSSRSIEWMAFPMRVKDVRKFNALNVDRVVVNVFGYDDAHYFPIYVEKGGGTGQMIDVLYYDNHFYWIKSLMGCLKKTNRLLSNKSYELCRRCFCTVDKRYMTRHRSMCDDHREQKLVFPPDHTTIKFSHYERQEYVPFMVMSDFECFNVPTGEKMGRSRIVTQHRLNSYCWILQFDASRDYAVPPPAFETTMKIRMVENDSESEANRLIQCYLEELNAIAIRLKLWLVDLQEASSSWRPTFEEERQFQASTHCRFCGKTLDDDRVRDHDHFTGRYRGAAHNACNLKSRTVLRNVRLRVGFHNFGRYDAYPLMYHLQSNAAWHIITNGTQIKSLQSEHLQFFDTYLFMTDSLKRIADTLTEDQMTTTRKYFTNARTKGVYPYSYIDGVEKFRRGFPSYDCFYDVMSSNNPVSQREWDEAYQFYVDMNMTSFADYHRYYLLLDTCLLCDAMTWFREFVYDQYGLDVSHYISLPSFTWDNALRYTGVELQKISDGDMFTMIERGLRGGVCFIGKRESSSNHVDRFIVYDDANNLYGLSMSQALPTDQFEWATSTTALTAKEWWRELMSQRRSDQGYILEVDLDYPFTLHEAHSDFPLAPEKMRIEKRMLNTRFSPYDLHNNKIKKLVPNLFDKKRYVVYYKNLEYYLYKGMELRKIHRVLSFREVPFLKPYMEWNTKLRSVFKHKFQQTICKNLNNMTFGKTIENQRDHVNTVLVPNTMWQKQSKLLKKPNYVSFKKNLFNALIFSRKTTVHLEKPIYVGFVVLEMSKLHMSKYFYEVVKPTFDDVRVCMTDTDSFILEVNDVEFRKKRRAMIERYMDASNFPPDSKHKSSSHAKLMGYFKDEIYADERRVVDRFIGVRPKCYIVDTVDCGGNDHKTKKAMKGVQRREQESIAWSQFESCLLDRERFECGYGSIHIRNNQPCTRKGIKTCLSAEDDKRFVSDDGRDSKPLGHYRNHRRYDFASIIQLGERAQCGDAGSKNVE